MTIYDKHNLQTLLDAATPHAGFLSKIKYFKVGKGLTLSLEIEGQIHQANISYSEAEGSEWQRFHEEILPNLDTGLTTDNKALVESPSLLAATREVRDDTRASYGRLRPDQTYIERWGVRNVSGTIDQIFLDSVAVPAGYSPQYIEYTVPAGKIFLLKGWRVALDAPGNSVNVMIALEIGADRKVRMSLNTNSPSQEASFNPALEIPEGTSIKVYAHTSQGSAITFVRFAGIEEDA